MSKNKKPKPLPVKKLADPERQRRNRRLVMHSMAALVFIGLCGGGMLFMHEYVEKQVVFPDAPPRVVLKDRPVWMSDLLAEQIARTARPIGTHSTFDHQMLVTVHDTLKASPWVREVRQIRRVYGGGPGDTLEIDCEFRAPVALVRWGDFYWLVDNDGVRLPEQFNEEQLPRIITGNDGRTNIRVVDGVRRPPPEMGQRWESPELAAAIALVKLLYGQTYTDEIIRVDVSNFQGRNDVREAHIALGTKYDTQIRWGRPLSASDEFEVSTAQKLDYLQQIHEKYGRVDANQPWIDIRFDRVTHPRPGLASHADSRN